ncbi:RNA polymerase sigma factor [candidate division CSSED10-310 bacterium]|uniref:RNA polymerase sigma factor n=1 Tax=candidate division CSSED10-310 bacterium TaxID=2855610 RepID=A0ABV6YXF1_UNCC1
MDSSKNITDAELVKRLQASPPDISAFNIIYYKHRNKVFHEALKHVKEPEAEDIVQDVFLKFHNNISKIYPGSLTWWFVTTTKNTALNVVRRKRLINFSSLEDNETDSNCTTQHQTEIDTKLDLNKMIQNLGMSPQTLKMLRLRFGDGESYKSIAIKFNSSIPTVKSKIKKSRKIFKKIYERHFGKKPTHEKRELYGEK